ncbi:hypothetical protein QN379_10935 [Glaciimonas sp. Gout2]|uniref:hypothetical protein n=1 Tax=unclassified Glaciimonas TaxID=2644401 RepID=UPI002B230CC6|nr:MULTISPECIES: hypothetical protein [unclassified Glaciimonas]MEB0013231.1 hypothetical protein [Glaciimonas sp. Cout2]MEB0082528.1 hypothetical protein [Glaciimonas sp. Gout2]
MGARRVDVFAHNRWRPNKNDVTQSEAVLEESVASYRQRVLVAFSEVEDNLAGLRILPGQAAQIDDALV